MLKHPDATASSTLHSGMLTHRSAEALQQAAGPQDSALGMTTTTVSRAASLLACMELVADPARAMSQAAARRQQASDVTGMLPIAQPEAVVATEMAHSLDGAELLLLARTPARTSRSVRPEGWGAEPGTLSSSSDSSNEDATDAVGSAAKAHRLRVMAWAKTMQGALHAEEGGGSHREAAQFSPGRHRRRRMRLEAALAASAERARVRTAAAASATTKTSGEGCEAAAALSSSSLDPSSLRRLELPDPGRIRDVARLKLGGLSRSISDNSVAMRMSHQHGHEMASAGSAGCLGGSSMRSDSEQGPCNSNTADMARRDPYCCKVMVEAADADRCALNKLAAPDSRREEVPLSNGSRATSRSEHGGMPAAAATKPPLGPHRSIGNGKPRFAAPGAAPASGSWWGLGSALWQIASAVQRRASAQQQQQQSSGSHLVSVWQQLGAHRVRDSGQTGASGYR